MNSEHPPAGTQLQLPNIDGWQSFNQYNLIVLYVHTLFVNISSTFISLVNMMYKYNPCWPKVSVGAKERLQKYILYYSIGKVSFGTEEERELGINISWELNICFSADQHISFNLHSNIWDQGRIWSDFSSSRKLTPKPFSSFPHIVSDYNVDCKRWGCYLPVQLPNESPFPEGKFEAFEM